MNRKEYLKQWREKNKERIKQYKKDYSKFHDSSWKKKQKENQQLKDRINKAIEITKTLEHSDWVCFGRNIIQEILKGNDYEKEN